MKLLPIVLGFILCTAIAKAQVNGDVSPVPTKVRIQVVIAGTDEYKDIVASYIKSELRKINDVSVVDNDPLMTISLTVQTLKNTLGMKTGYVVSYVILTQVQNIIGKKLVDSSSLDDGMKQRIDSCFKNVGTAIDSFTVVVPPDNLQDTIKENVAKIDGADIEQMRPVLTKLQQSPLLQKSQ
jgi:hypothetical protein